MTVLERPFRHVTETLVKRLRSGVSRAKAHTSRAHIAPESLAVLHEDPSEPSSLVLWVNS